MIRVVVAEDQGLVLHALAALIELDGDIQVVGRATNGKQALELTKALVPDVLVTDIEMPDQGGLDVALDLRAARIATKVVVVTTFARVGYVRRAVEAGVRGFLSKESPDDVLADAIRRVASGGRAIDPALNDLIWQAPDNPLSAKERRVLLLAGEGMSTSDIARAAALTSGTVRNYISEAVQKIGAANRFEAALIARQNGWL